MDIGYESHNAFSKAFRKWYGFSPRAFRDRSVNINSFEFTFAELGPFRPTYSSGCPFVRKIQPRQFIYLNAYGLLNGTFVKAALQRLAEVESALSQLGLAKYICGRVGAFPTRPTRFMDPDAPIQVGAIVAKRIDHIEPLKSRLLAGGRWAVFCHIRPFEFVMQTWNAALYNWLPSNGLLPRDDTPFEWYKDIFSQTPIAQQRAFIHIPIH